MAFQRSAHDKKYDRQMRLWGGHGQSALESSRLCVLGSGATASEILKNLVLPKVGHFTLIDDAVVGDNDFENNFFVEQTDRGNSRAAAVTKNLLELNKEVQGEAVHKNVSALIASDPSYFLQFTVVIACNIDAASSRKLAAYLYANTSGADKTSVPLIIVNNRGFQATSRLQVREHLINESHPSGDRSDLFLHDSQLARFPALHSFLTSFTAALEDKASVDSEEHGHIPYPAILLFVLNKWKKQNGDRFPSTYDEKKSFRSLISTFRITKDEMRARKVAKRRSEWQKAVAAAEAAGSPAPAEPTAENDDEDTAEVNFDEAEENIARILNKFTPDSFLSSVLSDAQASSLTSTSSGFWILVRAVRDFVSENGHFPASTDIPDMHCRTAYYLHLKSLYAAKAAEDLANITSRVSHLLSSLGRSPTEIDSASIAFFVKHVKSLRCVRTSPLEAEYDAGTFNKAAVNSDIEDFKDANGITDEEEEEDESEEEPKPLLVHNIQWYLGLRAVSDFLSTHGREAGTLIGDGSESSTLSARKEEDPDCELTVEDIALERDTHSVHELMQSTASKLGLDVKASVEVAFEVARSGGAELHNVAAFMGGVVAQEVLKLIIKQFVPLNNTFIYNGIDSSSTTLPL